MINQEYPVLDHGLVRVVDVMGNDISITQAARVSSGERTKGLRQDEKLIRYLMRNNHTSPFKMCEINSTLRSLFFLLDSGYATAPLMLMSIQSAIQLCEANIIYLL